MRPEDMYAAILLLAIVGYGLNRLFVTLERRLLPWFYAGTR
jgi:NitT/TauT family transport system permease protein/sulfonate transport system permease protein